MTPPDDFSILRDIRTRMKSLRSFEAIELLREMLDDLISLKKGAAVIEEGDEDVEGLETARAVIEVLKTHIASMIAADAILLGGLALQAKGAESFTSRQVSSEFSQAGIRRPANISTVMDSLKVKKLITDDHNVEFNKHRTFRFTAEGRSVAGALLEKFRSTGETREAGRAM